MMQRFGRYALLMLVATLLQIFLFDNLSLGIYADPLVYVVFVALLPLDALPVVVLLAGLAMGVAMDVSMGAAGINTIATLLVAFVRPWLLGAAYRRDDLRDGGVPSPERLGRRAFLGYIVLLVVLHHTVFFSLEALSWAHWARTLLRIVVSSLLSIVFVMLIARVFTSKLTTRI